MSAMSELHASVTAIAERENDFCTLFNDDRQSLRWGMLTAGNILLEVAESFSGPELNALLLAHEAIIASVDHNREQV